MVNCVESGGEKVAEMVRVCRSEWPLLILKVVRCVLLGQKETGLMVRATLVSTLTVMAARRPTARQLLLLLLARRLKLLVLLQGVVVVLLLLAGQRVGVDCVWD